MNARRGSTCSPISVEKISSDAIASSICTRSRRRTAGSIVVSHSCAGIHLAQALVALQRDAVARLGEQPVERLLERLDRLLLVAAPDDRARQDQPLQHVGRGADLREVADGEEVAVDGGDVRRAVVRAHDDEPARLARGVVARLDA